MSGPVRHGVDHVRFARGSALPTGSSSGIPSAHPWPVAGFGVARMAPARSGSRPREDNASTSAVSRPPTRLSPRCNGPCRRASSTSRSARADARRRRADRGVRGVWKFAPTRTAAFSSVPWRPSRRTSLRTCIGKPRRMSSSSGTTNGPSGRSASDSVRRTRRFGPAHSSGLRAISVRLASSNRRSRTYAELAAYGETAAGGLPAGLVARRARCDLLARLGRRPIWSKRPQSSTTCSVAGTGGCHRPPTTCTRRKRRPGSGADRSSEARRCALAEAVVWLAAQEGDKHQAWGRASHRPAEPAGDAALGPRVRRAARPGRRSATPREPVAVGLWRRWPTSCVSPSP